MKNKNLTFKNTDLPHSSCFGKVVTDISGDDYCVYGIAGDVMLTGPAVDRLHEFEELGMEPGVIKVLGKRHKLTIKENEDLKKQLKEQKANLDIHKLIDEVREKKDCYVHILIGENYTSVDIRPDEPGLQSWIATTERHGGRVKNIFACPNCGYIDEKPGLYCRFCGEQLGVPKPEQPKSEPNDTPKKMTCREKLKEEHPDKINYACHAGCNGCPHKYGYAKKPDDCNLLSCKDCWDREVEE